MLSSRALLLTLSLSLALTACGPDGGEDLLTPPGTESSVASSLIVTNEYSSTAVVGLFLSPSRRESWGANQIDDPIEPGDEFTLRKIPCNESYDLKVEYDDGDTGRSDDLFFKCGYDKVITLGPN
jgi:hypothetical protein